MRWKLHFGNQGYGISHGQRLSSSLYRILIPICLCIGFVHDLHSFFYHLQDEHLKKAVGGLIREEIKITKLIGKDVHLLKHSTPAFVSWFELDVEILRL
jgi:hypothetical protein